MNVTVYYEDTDAQGVVYHANYLKYFERARSNWLMQQTEHWENMCTNKEAFVIKSLSIDYLVPAKLGDLLHIKSHFEVLRPTLGLWRQAAYRADICLCRGELEMAFVNARGQPRALPDFVKAVSL
jgi:acyl-CoA thioester hydrolase|tara:strand:- start:1661 stop:2035 length:375 start_codon:yes stop_codon:yes gene_type:complete